MFRETASGAKTDRRELAKALRALDAGDTLLVTRLDRLARSTRDLLNILDTIAKAGAGFRSLGDAWADTTTPHGRLMLTVLGGLAEFERELIRARTGEGRDTRQGARRPHGAPAEAHPSPEARGARKRSPKARRRKPTWRGGSISARARFHGWRRRPLPAAPDRSTGARRRDGTRRARLHAAARRQVSRPLKRSCYGSRARGDHKPDSDADIAVILKGERGDRYKVSGDMAGIAFDVMMETGVMVRGCPFGKRRLRQSGKLQQSRLDRATSSARGCGYETDAAFAEGLHRKAEAALWTSARLLLRSERRRKALAVAPITRCLMRLMRRCSRLTSNKSPRRSRTHNGLVALFGQRIVLAGHMSAEYGEALNRAQRFRQLADYSGEPVGPEDAKWAVKQAEDFVAAVRRRFPIA